MTVLADLGYGTLYGLVLLGAVPAAVNLVQYVMVAFHGRHDHYRKCDPEFVPRLVVLIPAWNEAPVLRFSVDRMMALDYPPDRLRVAVVDDGSSDGTAELLAAKERAYPGHVQWLHRENGGQGKAHTLNHGLRIVLADDWAEAVLITDADVVFLPDSLRRMVRHLADPDVGAVTAFIREASSPPNWMNRYVGYEYIAAQAVIRRSQNVMGALACLAGGAQLHTRSNLEALGGRIDTSTLAEDTVTTFETQLQGRHVIFDGNAQSLAEEPPGIAGLWKQRLRWSRGNVQVSRRYAKLFFHPSRQHKLGGILFGLMWYSTLLLPVLMIVSSTALLALWFLNGFGLVHAYLQLWIINALIFVFTTAFSLIIDPKTARTSWRHALLFPGLVSLTIMVIAVAPRPMQAVGSWFTDHVGNVASHVLLLFIYLWVAGCMLAAWAVYRLDRTGKARWLVPWLLAVVGYGPLLCAITFSAYVSEMRGASLTWDKTEKTGKVGGAV